MEELKLYIWSEFYPVYDVGLAFAIAFSESHAQDLVKAEQGYTSIDDIYLEWGPLEIYELTEPIARSVVGGGQKEKHEAK